jgi:hypothetical protein
MEERDVVVTRTPITTPDNPIGKSAFAVTSKLTRPQRRCFCPLEDFRRIATRYDKLARNFFSDLCFVATLAYWL